MIDSIRAWISGNSPDHRKETGRRQEALQLALTALLIEAANSDHRFDETERGVISRLLESRFGLSRADANELLGAGETAAHQTKPWSTLVVGLLFIPSPVSANVVSIDADVSCADRH